MLSLPPLDTSLESPGLGAVVLLAVLQGVAEFLPISSSGHLVLARGLVGLEEAGLSLDVALHVGTLAAVLVAYRREVAQLIRDLLGGKLHMIGWLIVATIPVGVAGVLLDDALDRAAQTSVVAGYGLFATAIFLIIGDRARRRLGSAADGDEGGYGAPAWRLAVLLGLAQMLAICPGVSRSGTTIAAGLVLGLPIAQAARYSFLMSIPAILGAAVFKLPDALGEGIGDLRTSWVLIGVAIAAVAGWASLRVLLVVTSRGAFPWFAGYCALLGAGALLFL